jgi:hypothetical protein
MVSMVAGIMMYMHDDRSKELRQPRHQASETFPRFQLLTSYERSYTKRLNS